MRLYAFDDHQLGVLGAAGHLVDITALVESSIAPRDRMTALIAGWSELGDAVRAAASVEGGTPLDAVHLVAPQPRPGKIIAAPVNYRLHQQEMGGVSGVYSDATVKTIETYAGFIKASSSIVGPDGVIELPPGDRRIDHEAELGVVIGRAARNVRRDEALEYVFGYVPLLDITMRGEEDRSFRKSFDTFTPIGPAIVTADEVGNPGELDLALTVDGELRQSSNTREMIFDVPRLIELYSRAMTLEPGDLIATGTPEGVGQLEPGQEVTLEVEGVGRLVMPVRVRDTVLR